MSYEYQDYNNTETRYERQLDARQLNVKERINELKDHIPERAEDEEVSLGEMKNHVSSAVSNVTSPTATYIDVTLDNQMQNISSAKIEGVQVYGEELKQRLENGERLVARIQCLNNYEAYLPCTGSMTDDTATVAFSGIVSLGDNIVFMLSYIHSSSDSPNYELNSFILSTTSL